MGGGGQTLNAGTRGTALRLRNKYGTSCEPVSLRSGSSHLDTIHPQLNSHRHDNRYHDNHLLHAKDQELQLPAEMQGAGGAGEGEILKNRENDRDVRARHRMGTEMQGQREAGGHRGRGGGDREDGVEGGLGVPEKEREGKSGRRRERILSHLNLASRSSDTKLGKGPPQ